VGAFLSSPWLTAVGQDYSGILLSVMGGIGEGSGQLWGGRVPRGNADPLIKAAAAGEDPADSSEGEHSGDGTV